MRLYQKIIAGGLVVAGLAGLVGCKEDNPNQRVQQNNQPAYSQNFEDVGRIGGGYNDFTGGSGVAVGDMDGDGDLDIIVADRGASLHYLENIDGRFEDRGRITKGRNDFSGDSDLTLADIDKDGDLDIIYTDRSASVYIVKNNIPQKNK